MLKLFEIFSNVLSKLSWKTLAMKFSSVKGNFTDSTSKDGQNVSQKPTGDFATIWVETTFLTRAPETIHKINLNPQYFFYFFTKSNV